MKFLRDVKKYAFRYKQRILATASIVFATALLLALLGYLKNTIVLIVLLMVAVLPTIYKRWLRVSIGIEFMVFATVIAGFAYGWKTGFVFGAGAMLVSDVVNRTIGEWTPWNMAGVGLCGFIAGYFSSLGLVAVGIIATISSEIFRQLPSFLVSDISIRIKNIAIAAIHVAFNLWLFSTFGSLIQELL